MNTSEREWSLVRADVSFAFDATKTHHRMNDDVRGNEREREEKCLPWRTQRPVDDDRAKPGRHTQLTPVVALEKRMHTARLSHLAQFGSSDWPRTRRIALLFTSIIEEMNEWLAEHEGFPRWHLLHKHWLTLSSRFVSFHNTRQVSELRSRGVWVSSTTINYTDVITKDN